MAEASTRVPQSTQGRTGQKFQKGAAGVGDVLGEAGAAGGSVIRGAIDPLLEGLGFASEKEVNQRKAEAAQALAGREGQFQDVTGTLQSQLTRQALGQGPSLAAEQARLAGDQAARAQMAAAAGARPGSGGMAQRLAAQQAGQATGQAAQAAGLAQLKEQQAAQQQLGGLAQTLETARQADIQRKQEADKQQSGIAGAVTGLLGSIF